MDSIQHLETIIDYNNHYYKSPCGILQLSTSDNHLCICDWVNKEVKITSLTTDHNPILHQAVHELDEYFMGKRKQFDLPLCLGDVCSFKKDVLCALLLIPYGTTISYKQLAEGLGKPRHIRVIAQILSHNVCNIFLPCHRVIGSDGTLVGYRGGIDAKKYLLNLEQR